MHISLSPYHTIPYNHHTNNDLPFYDIHTHKHTHMQELTAGILTPDTATPSQAPVIAGAQKAAPVEEEEEEDTGMTEEEMSGYQDRLRNI